MSKPSKSRSTPPQKDNAKVTISAQSLIPQVAITTILHPFTYGKILIQLGHEPLKPIKRHTFASLFRLGTKKYAYPSIFSICSNIKNQDGWIALWTTGLVANVFQVTIQSHVYNYAVAQAKAIEGENKDGYVSELLKEISAMLIARSVSDIASQPFFVIMVRQMASFADKPPVYTSFANTTATIWREEGVKGFFAGLVPRLLGDAVSIVLTQMLARALSWLLDRLAAHERGADFEPGAETKTGVPSTTTISLAGLIASSFSYPYTVVSTVMCINNTRLKLAGAVAFNSWRQCWTELNRTGEAKRGMSLFFRYLTDYQLKQQRLVN